MVIRINWRDFTCKSYSTPHVETGCLKKYDKLIGILMMIYFSSGQKEKLATIVDAGMRQLNKTDICTTAYEDRQFP